MEVLHCRSNCSSIALHLLPYSPSTTPQRHGGSYNTAWSATGPTAIEKLGCSNSQSLLLYPRWKENLGFCDLNGKNGNSRTVSGWRLPRRDRRDASSRCAKNNLHGGFEEPVQDGVAETLVQDGSNCSSLGKALHGGKVPIINLADAQDIITIPSGSMSVQASASKMDGLASRLGVLITGGHFLLAAGALLLVESQLSKTIPLTVVPFALISPFILSAAVTAILGYFFVPVLKHFRAAQVFRIEGPTSHVVKRGTPTMGGLFFVPVGVAIAGIFTGFNSIEVQGATVVTLTFAGIGLMDDGLAFWRNHNYGLPGKIKFMLQVAVGIIFFIWLDFANLSSVNKIKHAVWLPAPFGLVCLGRWYLPLTAFCCAAMSNGVNLTDGLDGLAGGTAAIAFIAMSVVVLPSFPALGVFGSSMAGACFGFLVHNRYKASVFMGDTGSLALGGALAAMACWTGMFLPLFIASGVFVIETVSVMGQVFYFKLTKKLYGEGRRWLRMAPFHHHVELIGLKEPVIITIAYSLSIFLAIAAAHLVLRSS